MRKKCNNIHHIPAIQTLWLLFKEKRTASEQQFVQSLLEQSELIARTYEYIRRFRPRPHRARRDSFTAVAAAKDRSKVR